MVVIGKIRFKLFAFYINDTAKNDKRLSSEGCSNNIKICICMIFIFKQSNKMYETNLES